MRLSFVSTVSVILTGGVLFASSALGGPHPEAGLLLQQMRGQSLKAIMIGGGRLDTSELW